MVSNDISCLFSHIDLVDGIANLESISIILTLCLIVLFVIENYSYSFSIGFQMIVTSISMCYDYCHVKIIHLCVILISFFMLYGCGNNKSIHSILCNDVK